MKKRNWKKAAVLLCITMAASLLGGCEAIQNITGNKFDAAEYVGSTLDAVYKGDFAKNAEVTGAKVEEIEENYNRGIANDLQRYMVYYGLEGITDNMKNQYKEWIKKLNKSVMYHVGEVTEKGKGNYLVEVKIQPMDIFTKTAQGVNDFIAQFEDNNNHKMYTGYSDDEFHDVYAQGILDVLNQFTDAVKYEEEVTVQVEVLQSSKNVYTILQKTMDEVYAKLILIPDSEKAKDENAQGTTAETQEGTGQTADPEAQPMPAS